MHAPSSQPFDVDDAFGAPHMTTSHGCDVFGSIDGLEYVIVAVLLAVIAVILFIVFDTGIYAKYPSTTLFVFPGVLLGFGLVLLLLTSKTTVKFDQGARTVQHTRRPCLLFFWVMMDTTLSFDDIYGAEAVIATGLRDCPSGKYRKYNVVLATAQGQLLLETAFRFQDLKVRSWGKYLRTLKTRHVAHKVNPLLA